MKNQKLVLVNKILNRVNLFKQNLLTSFGLGVDGKPIVAQGPDGRLGAAKPTGGANLVSKVTKAFSTILSPFKAIADGIMGFIEGTGRALFKFIDTWILPGVKTGASVAGGAVVGVAKLMGKILLPLGILFSAFDAFKAWQETDGTFGEKFYSSIFCIPWRFYWCTY